MERNIFFNTQDKQSKLAKKLLNENKIKFIEIFSNNYDTPRLLAKESVYSYRGLDQIKQYINSQK